MDGIASLAKTSGDDTDQGLDLFQKYEPSNIYSFSKYVQHKPINALSESGPYKFEIGGFNSKEFVMLKSLRMSITFKIVVDDNTSQGKNLTEEHKGKISVVNTIGHALWDNIGVTLNNELISEGNRTYPYRAYIQQVFSYSKASKEANLNCEYFKKDEIARSINVDPGCEGFKKRSLSIDGSKEITINIIPYIDILNTVHFLAPNHKLTLEFERNRPEFYILTNLEGRYKAVITDLSIYVRKVELAPAIANKIEQKQNHSPVYYPITRSIIRKFQIHAGVSLIYIPNMFNARLPRSIYIVFLNNKQYPGAYNVNPFVFQSYNLREASVNLNGFPYPAQPLKFDFEAGEIREGYRWFLDNIGWYFLTLV